MSGSVVPVGAFAGGGVHAQAYVRQCSAHRQVQRGRGVVGGGHIDLQLSRGPHTVYGIAPIRPGFRSVNGGIGGGLYLRPGYGPAGSVVEYPAAEGEAGGVGGGSGVLRAGALHGAEELNALLAGSCGMQGAGAAEVVAGQGGQAVGD